MRAASGGCLGGSCGRPAPRHHPTHFQPPTGLGRCSPAMLAPVALPSPRCTDPGLLLNLQRCLKVRCARREPRPTLLCWRRGPVRWAAQHANLGFPGTKCRSMARKHTIARIHVAHSGRGDQHGLPTPQPKPWLTLAGCAAVEWHCQQGAHPSGFPTALCWVGKRWGFLRAVPPTHPWNSPFEDLLATDVKACLLLSVEAAEFCFIPTVASTPIAAVPPLPQPLASARGLLTVNGEDQSRSGIAARDAVIYTRVCWGGAGTVMCSALALDWPLPRHLCADQAPVTREKPCSEPGAS